MNEEAILIRKRTVIKINREGKKYEEWNGWSKIKNVRIKCILRERIAEIYLTLNK